MLRKALLLIVIWGYTPPVPVSTAKAGDDHHTVVSANIEIIDVSDAYFERLGMDLKTLLPTQSIPSNARHVGLISAEESKPHAILTPLECRLLHRFLKKEDYHIIKRPQVRIHPSQVLKFDGAPPAIINGIASPPLNHLGKNEEVRVEIEMVVTVAENGKHLVFKIDGQSQDKPFQVRAAVPEGKTLLTSLGSHTVDVQSESAVPILNKIPITSRLFKNTRVSNVTWHRLVFITPEVLVPEN